MGKKRKTNKAIETWVKLNTGILVFFLLAFIIGGILMLTFIMPYINDLNNLGNLFDNIPQIP